MANPLCDEFLHPGFEAEDPLYSSFIANSVFNAFSSYTAIMLNIVTIHAIRKTSSLPKPLKTLLLSLAVSDLGVGLLVQPFYIELMVRKCQENNSNCATYGAFTMLTIFFCFASFFGVVAISADRFLAIQLHLRYQELVTHKRVVAVVISVWVLSAILSLTSLLPKMATYAIFVTVDVVCFLTTTLIYCNIFVVVRNHTNQTQTLPIQEQQLELDEVTHVASLRKTALSTFYVYLMFFLCYLPQNCMFVVSAISDSSTVTNGLLLYTASLVFLNSTLNPVIYCWKMRHIRQATMAVLRNIFSGRN
ncbi:adenosine receptor A2a-like [Oculina patagonica]